ncbi:hypothetical protein V6N13_123695 [Hibiscus sabdariffa]|uniref:Uncharacterized protein n=1 Tax=Hibiscus sabdariffa TaxID=183260 RepID=A0ABR2QU76_9ROSI
MLPQDVVKFPPFPDALFATPRALPPTPTDKLQATTQPAQTKASSSRPTTQQQKRKALMKAVPSPQTTADPITIESDDNEEMIDASPPQPVVYPPDATTTPIRRHMKPTNGHIWGTPTEETEA